LGLVAWAQGDLTQSAALHEEALALARETGDRHEVALVLVNLGYAAEDGGDLAQARARYAEAVPILREVEQPWVLALCLEGLAGLAAVEGNAACAVRILSAVSALREALDLPLPPLYRPRRDRLLMAARMHLGSVASAKAWDEGRELPLAEVLVEALTEPVEP
jgi:hypothetical protein